MKCLELTVVVLQQVIVHQLIGLSTGSSFDLIQRFKINVTTSMSSEGKYQTNNPHLTSWISDNAIDNKYSDTSDPNICSCCSGTDGTEPPWWQINLGKQYLVESITIIGRPDAGNNDIVKEQYSSLWIYVGNMPLININGSLVYQGNPNNGSYTYFLQSTFPRFFQYLIIKKFVTGYLTICKVQITAIDSNIQMLPNLYNFSSTSQSSTFLQTLSKYNSSKAVDGIENYDIDNCECCSVTNADVTSWWQINLGKQFLIGGVEVFGRQSAPSDQLKLASIIAGNSTVDGNPSVGDKITTIPELQATEQHYFKILDSPMILQYISIILEGKTLTICEFRLFSKVCEVGDYGNGCAHHCHCSDGQQCDAVTGHCQSPGCLQGWTGETCDTCSHGYFGNNCLNKCHCTNNTDCDKETGICLGGCAPGWNGTSCNQDLNLILQLRNTAITDQSGIYHNSSFDSTKAIDGVDNYNVSSCGCCSITSGSVPAWWQIDLGDKYLIGDVEIFGRQSGSPEQLREAIIRAGNTSMRNDISVGENISMLPWFSASDSQHFYITLHSAIIAQHFEVMLKNESVLTICEFRLFIKECPVGKFGNGCAHECHCSDGKPCVSVTGQCVIPGCLSGWTGTSCDIECARGYYGQNCNESCGKCNVGTYCNETSGICPQGCQPGYIGNTCKEACEDGRFGQDCKSTCSLHCYNGTSQCDKQTGTCKQGCEAGYMDSNCTTECPNGYYGRNCTESCGKCTAGAHCSTTSGFCPHGCLPGYIGNTCKDECKNGNFGDGCREFCFCKNDEPCNKTNGKCPNGCNIMWTEENCSKPLGIDFRTLPNVNTTQIGTFLNDTKYSAIKAIDGVKNYSVDTCGCCSVALTSGTMAWWQIDLGQEYLIDAISLFGRSDGVSQLQIEGAGVYAGNESLSANVSSGSLVYTVPFNIGSKFHFDSLFNSSIVARFFVVRIQNNTLTLCEFYVRKKECSVGNFGIGCLHECHCKGQSECDPATGRCKVEDCEPGWKGEACDINCPWPTFGYRCNRTCHCKSCDPVNGTCSQPKCDPGWKGPSCSQECDKNTFGDDCNNTCHCSACHHVNGTCFPETCDPGWQARNCSQECEHGHFGMDCLSMCHCVNGTECHHISGLCYKSECAPGWTESNCSVVCKADSFGENCSRTCNCFEDSCNPVNGTCNKRLLGCKPGWQGEACETRVEKSTGQDSSVALAGGTSAAVIVVAIAVLVGFFLYRRHKSKSTNQDSGKTFSHLDEALRQKQQRRAESHSSRRVAGNDNSAYIETNVDDKSYAKEQTGAEDTGGGYYDFAEVVGIRIHELWDYIHEKTKNECEQLYGEFKKLPSGLIHPCTIAEQLANRGKNRYREMYAYDHTRVILEEKNDKGTDYVNANYIDGYSITRKFVACQGPTKQTIEDFWKMIWQLKSDKIVMLTNLVEQGATKCVLYWPKDEEFSYGKVNVKIVKLDTDLDFDVRHLDVWKEGESPRRIRQYHFKSWPDKDVPDSTWCLLKFWRAVQTDAKSKAGPVIVHCSAGVGRTGTFIALDNLIHQARDEGCVRPFQVVRSLREQRINMVQTKEQYVYLHEVLADALCFGTHFVWSTQFEPMYMSLLQREDGEAKTRLEVQYDLIQKSLKNTVSKEAEAAEYSNMEMILSESDAYRPKLKKRGSKFVQQLGATLIPNYDGRNTFLVAMSPDKSTIEEFWSLVDDLNIKTVVLLTEKSSTCYKASCDLGSHNDNGTKFHVNKVEENIRKGHTERTFTFKESNREEEDHLATVKQFEYTAWKDGYVVPGDARSLVDFLEAIFKWQSHFSESQPVLIYDGDGCSRSGILCVALNEVQRIKTEGGHINIVQSVKMMKQRKQQLIHSFDQYKFCYELILAYLKQTEVYQNLK